jgi:metallo-beta-lactamase family protein
MELTFLGGAGTVTGSRTLVTHGATRLLVDCGLFQGFKHLRLMNRRPMDALQRDLSGVVLTHAHLDHSGAAPLLAREGWRGPIHATPGTAALCGILWSDAAHLQEEEAERANRKGWSKHHPALPLYDADDARQATRLLRAQRPGTPFKLGEASLTFRRAGHILGASSLLIELAGRRVMLSGDVGRLVDPVQGGPDDLPEGLDLLVLESTYGDRLHAAVDVELELGRIVRETYERGGHLLVPCFAVGRVQRILYHLARLRQRGEIPDVPVFLNSPMAAAAMQAFLDHPECHRLSAEDVDAISRLPHLVATKEESIELNKRQEPAILLAGSGMATGGRILHHLAAFGPHPQHTILLTGFQAGGTRGDRLIRGERELKIFGSYVPIQAHVEVLHNLSAHADQAELLAWLRTAKKPPARVLLNHGEPAASDALRLRIQEELHIACDVPFLGEEVAF